MVTTSPTLETTLDGETAYLVSSDATTGATLGRVAMTPPEAVETVAAEVAAARRAWEATPLRERGRVIAEAAQVLLRRSDELATAVTRETGKPLMESTAIDVGGPRWFSTGSATTGHASSPPNGSRRPNSCSSTSATRSSTGRSGSSA